MDEGELVYCSSPDCRQKTFVKYHGTMPTDWYGVWIEAQRHFVRCCSEACLKTTKEYYRDLSGSWTICTTTIDTRKRKPK